MANTQDDWSYPMSYDPESKLKGLSKWVLYKRIPIPKSDSWSKTDIPAKESLYIPSSDLQLGKFTTFWVGINIQGSVNQEDEMMALFAPVEAPVIGEIRQIVIGSPDFKSDLVSLGESGGATPEGRGTGEGYAFHVVANPDKESNRKHLYNLEVDNLKVRGNLSSRSMIFQFIKGVNGTLMVTSTGKIKVLTTQKLKHIPEV
jgi:hypothetical protein